MLQNSYNIFTSSIHEEVHDLINSYTGQESESNTTESYIDEDGHILIPLNSNSFFDEQFSDYQIDDDENNDEDGDRYLSGLESTSIFDEVDHNNIMKIKGTLTTLQDILLELFTNKDSSIYGITVVDGNKRYNVLHPITAHMIQSGEIIISNDILIMIYSYKYSSVATESDKNINKISNILKIINDCGYKTKSRLFYNQDNNTLHDNVVTSENFLDYNFAFEESGGARPEYGILPVQFMTDNVSFPYYGIVASRTTGGSYNSINLVGMASGNINIEVYDTNGVFGTCTGNEPNNMFTSLFTLNDMNLFSLYNVHIIHDYNWKDWVFTCQMFSIYSMYSDIIDEQTRVKAEEDAESERLIQEANEKHDFKVNTDTFLNKPTLDGTQLDSIDETYDGTYRPTLSYISTEINPQFIRFHEFQTDIQNQISTANQIPTGDLI